MKKNFIIKDEFSGSRVDRWFRRNISDIPQSLIEKLLRKGKIRINKKKIRSSYKLELNDIVFVNNLNLRPNIKNKSQNKYIANKKELTFLSKIFIENNDNFVVINKPAGLAVQAGTKSRKNLIDLLRKTNEFQNINPYPVHRIDKDTTGLLIVAKNRKYAQLFTSLFRIKKIHKVYLGIIIGTLPNNSGTLIDDLFYYEAKKKIISRAITHFKVIDSNNKYSFLELIPETGRKHQLRKQLFVRGHPILGDTKYRIYNNDSRNKKILMLHAFKLYFKISNKKYNFEAELPLEFKNALKEKYLKIF